MAMVISGGNWGKSPIVTRKMLHIMVEWLKIQRVPAGLHARGAQGLAEFPFSA